MLIKSRDWGLSGLWLRRLLPVCLLVGVLLLAGCSRQEQQKPSQPPPLRLGWSLADGEQSEWAAVLRREIDRAAQDQRARILWRDATGDPNQQEKDVLGLVEQKPDAIILELVDPKRQAALARKVTAAGIKLVLLGEAPPDSPADALISPDAKRLGQLEAEFVIGALKDYPAGKAPVLVFSPQERGWRRATAEAAAALLEQKGLAPDLRQVSRQGGTALVLEALREDLPAAVITPGGEETKAVLEYLSQRQAESDLVTVGTGAGREAAAAVEAGRHEAEGDPLPEMVGRYALQAAIALAREGSWNYDRQLANGTYDLPARLTPVRLIKADNLYLLKERWGDLGAQQGAAQGGGGKQGDASGSGGGKSSGGGSGSEQGGGGQSQSQGQQPPQAKVIIKTKDGQTIEVNVPGEVAQITVEGPAEGQGGGGGQGGGQGGSGGQGSSGGS